MSEVKTVGYLRNIRDILEEEKSSSLGKRTWARDDRDESFFFFDEWEEEVQREIEEMDNSEDFIW